MIYYITKILAKFQEYNVLTGKIYGLIVESIERVSQLTD